MEHAERLERLDPLLGGANRRHRCASIIFFHAIARDLRISGWGSVTIICKRTSALLLFRALRLEELFASRLGQRDREENSLGHEQDEREDCRSGIDVELGAAQLGLPEHHRLRRVVRANGRADAEAYRERDAYMREGFCAVGGRSDIREDGAFVFLSQVRTSLPQIMLLKGNVHRQLDIALAQSSNDSRKHV